MTAHEFREHGRAHWMEAAIIALTLIIAVNYALLIPALKQQGQWAREGQQARTVQKARLPASCKIAIDAYHRHVITAGDLKPYLRTPNCP